VPVPKNLAPVALISQSGGFFDGFFGCPFGKGIDLGNTSDLDFVDAIAFFAKDNDIRVIVLHMEGISNTGKFMSLCRQVVKSKLIIAIKGGRSESGSRASASHTGSLTGDDELYSAMLRQSGIHQVGSVAVIGDIARAFYSLPPFTGNRVAVITPTGAGGIITLDCLENHGFKLAILAKKTVDGLAHLFQPWIKVCNPVDVLSAGMAHGFKSVYKNVLESCFKDKNVDIVMTVCGAYTLKTIKEISGEYSGKPCVAWVIGADQSLIIEKAKAYNFQSYFISPDRALYALKVVREYYMKNKM